MTASSRFDGRGDPSVILSEAKDLLFISQEQHPLRGYPFRFAQDDNPEEPYPTPPNLTSEF
jgi:hypothetical protein